MRCKKGLLLLIIASGIISAADNWIASLLLPSIADTFGGAGKRRLHSFDGISDPIRLTSAGLRTS